MKKRTATPLPHLPIIAESKVRLSNLGRDLRGACVVATIWISGTTGACAKADGPAKAVILSGGTQVIPYGLSRVSGIWEASPNRLFVADAMERIVISVDMDRGIIDTVSRPGSGPTEYELPQQILRFCGDSVLLFDGGSLRYAVLDSFAGVARTFRQTTRFGLVRPVGADTFGNVYLQTVVGHGSLYKKAEAFVIRWKPNGGGDTITSVRIPMYTEVTEIDSSGPVVMRTRMLRPIPYSEHDEWNVDAAGNVLIVRSSPYKIELWRDTMLIRSFGVNGQKRERVTALDKEPFTSNGARPQNRALPRRKAPFPTNALVPSQDGRVWLLTTFKKPPSAKTYMVFSDTGIKRFSVSLSGDRQIVHVGRDAVYATRRDEVDQLWLERYRLPR